MNAITRRAFLKITTGSSALCAWGATMPQFLTQTARAALEAPTSGQGTILVILQLSGGNDGLNTVVPFQDDAYHRSRSTLRLPMNQLHRLNETLGFHPELAAFHRLYQEGLLTVVQGVGYPQSNRDHDQAMRDWHTAQPGEAACSTGWVGRTLDHAYQHGRADLPGLFVGPIPTPFSLQTQKTIVPTLPSSLQDWPACPNGVPTPPSPTDVQTASTRHPVLPFLTESWAAARQTSRSLQAASQSLSSPSTHGYPDFRLAQTLHAVAELIRADLGIRIFYTELGGGGIGGFDTHANQRDNHAALLRQLSESVAAFARDLQRDRLLNQVMLMTFSEFGRTVSENGRRGTDHGAAAPLFLVGGKLQGGLIGDHPSLTDLEGDALKFHTDFRRVYATALDQWLGLNSAAILGRPYEPVPMLA